MAGIPHEEYLRRIFEEKARRGYEESRFPIEKKLEIWLRLREMVHYVQNGLGKDREGNPIGNR